eukprot:Em0057g25a
MPIIHQCTGTLDYMGLNGRLVIPPLTDRIYLTLSRALPCWYWKDEAPIRGFGPAAVLVMACELKQGPPGQNKDVVLMRPLRDMNFPKFVFEVFLGLIGDFFPGLDCPRVHYPKFNDAMEGVPSDGKHIQLPHRDGVCGSKEVGIQLCYVLKALLAIHIGQMTPLWSLTLWWLSTGFSGSSCGGMIDTYVKQQAQLPGLLDLGRSPPTTSTVQYSFAAQVGAVLLPTMNVSPAIPPWMCRGAWKPVWKRHFWPSVGKTAAHLCGRHMNSLQWISRMFRIYPSKATMELYDHAPSKFDCIFNLRDLSLITATVYFLSFLHYNTGTATIVL